MLANQKYLKDENGNIFSPIVNMDSIYGGGGVPYLTQYTLLEQYT